jgi:hypothetical protein
MDHISNGFGAMSTLNITHTHNRHGLFNWSPSLPDRRPVDYNVWGHMIKVVCERQVDIRDEVVQQIFHAARHVPLRKEGIYVSKLTVDIF